MLMKCETKSHRVKGVSFHPKLSWILASLHNGILQLWDYRLGSLIDSFEEHEGPVRGVDFHSTQPLFVSGGDDYRIKVWNYRQRRCIFTLQGHLDYIRTVQFHCEYPWVLSASDDQTVRIWNWQSRSCLAVLTGHNHYVMCAQFHPKADLVISASLDQTIRVWDISGLREKTVSISSGGVSTLAGSINNFAQQLHGPHQGGDIFGTSDAVCKHILEAHERGVNWATFHPSMPLIASGADDRLIKLWRYNENKAWEVDTFRGHFNNVSCVLFHPKRDLLISNSEDRTIRVWDTNRRTGLHTFRRDNDRFWTIAAHPTNNLLAVGHDSGMVVFKLERERPLAHAVGRSIYYVNNKVLYCHDLTSDTSITITSIRHTANSITGGPRQLLYNTLNSEAINIIIYYVEQDGTSYDLITCPFPKTAAYSEKVSSETRAGEALSVAFVARNRYAVLDKTGTIGIYNLSCVLSSSVEPSIPVDKIFQAHKYKLLLKSEERVVLYDLTLKKQQSELTVSGGVRHVVWSPDGTKVALISKHTLVLATANLDFLTSLQENIRVKSGVWDENGAFIFCTPSHIKYCLQNGESGIIHSLPEPVYLFKMVKQTLYYIDRQETMRHEQLNCTEYLFKIALQQKQHDQVNTFIRNGRLCGNAIIGYLRNNGHSRVAMEFVSDPKTRFNLALEYGDIDEALKCAQVLDEKASWNRLGADALRQGIYPVVEMVFQKVKNFEKLSFLYLITGNTGKLKKMLKIAEIRKDIMSRFHNALLLGDAGERVRIFAEVGQLALASLTAHVCGLSEYEEDLSEARSLLDFDGVCVKTPKLLTPPIPVYKAKDANLSWPTITQAQKKTDAPLYTDTYKHETFIAHNSLEALGGVMEKGSEDVEATGVWDDYETDLVDGDVWGTAELDNLGELTPTEGNVNTVADTPDKELHSHSIRVGDGSAHKWTRGQPVVADLVAAGEFQLALEVLQKRIGLINAEPLKKSFRRVYESTIAQCPGLPLSPSMNFPILADSQAIRDAQIRPYGLYTLPYITESIREAHKLVTAGKFQNALDAFKDCLQCLPLVSLTTQDEETQAHEYLETCRLYVVAMRVATEQANVQNSDPARGVELAAYFTTFKLEPIHQYLVLRLAMGVAFKTKNYITAASFAKRLTHFNIPNFKGASEDVGKARKVLMICEQNGSDTLNINYEPNDFERIKLCAHTLTRMEMLEPTVSCPYCGASCKAAYKGLVCETCNLAELGVRVLGVQFRPLQ